MSKATRNLCIGMIVLAIGAVVSYGYAIRYVSGLTQKTSDAKEQIDNLEIKYNHLNALHKAAQNTSDEKGKISSYIIPPGGSVNFITNLEQTAGSLGLTYLTDHIEAVNTGELDSHQKELLDISFTATGNWTNLIRFIKTVENMPYGFKIERMDLVSLSAQKFDATTPIVVATQAASAGTSTGSSSVPVVQKKVSYKENIWRVTLLFGVLKIKDN